MRLNHVALVCSSEQSANDFYEGTLGLEKIKAWVLSEDLALKIFGIKRECQVLVYGNDRFTAEVFVAADSPGGKASFEHACLEVEDVEELVRRCEARHVTLNRIRKGDRLLTFIRDFDGNLFEIKELPK